MPRLLPHRLPAARVSSALNWRQQRAVRPVRLMPVSLALVLTLASAAAGTVLLIAVALSVLGR